MDQRDPDEIDEVDEDSEDGDDEGGEGDEEVDDAPLPEPAAGGVAETEEIDGLVFTSNPEYPYPFKVAEPPRFWMEEQTGALEAAVESYIAGERLTPPQLRVLKIYLKQFVERAPLAGDAKVHLLVQRIERIKTNRDVEDFADELAEFGGEVF